MISGIAFIATLVLAGQLTGRALTRGRLGALESWALGCATALGLLTIAAFLFALAGWGLPGPLLQLAVLCGVVLLAQRLTRSSAPSAKRQVSTAQAAAATSGSLFSRLALGLAFGMALLMAGDWRNTEPAGNWDGMANWTTQARHLARTDGAPGNGLRTRLIGHPDYPLMLPLAIALGWQWTADESQNVPRLLAVLFLVLLAAAAVGSFSRVAGGSAGQLAAAALLATPAIQLAARGQIADVPLAALVLLAGTRLVSNLQATSHGQQPVTPQLLTGLLLGLLPWMKNEGLLLALCLLLATTPALLKRPTKLRLLAPWTLGAALPFTALQLFRNLWAPPDRMLAQWRPALRRFLPDPERWQVALDGVAREFIPLDFNNGIAGLVETPWLARWGGLSMLCLVALLLSVARRPRNALSVPLLATFGWLLALSLIYVLTIASDQRWHVDSSLWRLLLQILPFALFGALAGWSREPAASVMLRDSTAPQKRTPSEAP